MVGRFRAVEISRTLSGGSSGAAVFPVILLVLHSVAAWYSSELIRAGKPAHYKYVFARLIRSWINNNINKF
jgi:hypothetical protein